MKQVFLSIAFLFSALLASAQAPYSLSELNYQYNALEPHIDEQTMTVHHTAHHAAYINNLNNALVKYPEIAIMPLENLISSIYTLPEDIQTAVRNNGGGHYNHSLFWSLLTPAGTSKESGKIIDVIKRDFGSMDNFKEAFTKAATSRFGSGWVWLITTPEGKLSIESTANQDTPIMDVTNHLGAPVLCLDVWEHAYYLKFQSKRAAYVNEFWNVVNWDKVNELYNEAISGKNR